MEELDLNKMAAEFVNDRLDSFFSEAKGLLKGASDTIRLRLRRSYGEYLVCAGQRYSKAKSFFIRNEPTSLYQFYVPLDVSSGLCDLKNTSFPDLVNTAPHVVITGSGGIGKSILMRHLFLDAILHKQKVPVFVELRKMNMAGGSVTDLIIDTLRSNNFALDDEYIHKAVRAGHFAFFFDGFDEVAASRRKTVSKQILSLSQRADKNVLIVSSRPDNEFAGWPSFSVFEVESLSLEKACELVRKLPFDEEIKNKFLSDLRKRLFKEHESLLSNPLLLSIMLLTYGQSADIPTKLSIFYSQAYEALFQRHDVAKGGFQRERRTKLDIQDFAKVFSAFCIQTYDKRVFEMPSTEALGYLEKAKRIARVEFDKNDYLADAQQAVCLLIEEGLFVTFTHRSFQEYFVAQFIHGANSQLKKRLIQRYARNIGQDTVMSLLYEINPELVERNFILPGIEKLAELIGVKKKVGVRAYVRYLKTQYSSFRVNERSASGIMNHDYNAVLYELVHFTLNHCGHLIRWSGYRPYTPAIVKKYYTTPQTGLVEISNMSPNDEFFGELSSASGYHSKTTLDKVFEIKEAILRKHKAAEHSLDELLGV